MWLSSTAVGLASAVYADRLPSLAHCRGHPEHSRGCWVVDLILGKC